MPRPRISKIAPAPSDWRKLPYQGHIFVRSVPLSTRMAFKAECSKLGYTMRDVLIVLMRKFAEASREDRDEIILSIRAMLKTDDDDHTTA